MQSTYKLSTSDFVEPDMTFLGRTGGFPQEPTDQNSPGFGP